jgi:hypothetical protein
MKATQLLIRMLVLLSVLLAASCTLSLLEPQATEPQAVAVDHATPTVDLVAEAQLEQTVAITILERDQTTADFYVYHWTIDDPARVAQLIDALAVELPLTKSEPCPAFYKLQFQLADGSRQELAYACEHATPAFLHGEQGFWQDQQVVAPDEFNRLMEELLESLETQQSTPSDG